MPRQLASRRAQSSTEYMMTIAVIVIAIVAVLYVLVGTIYRQTGQVAEGLATSLVSDGVQ
jgi:uncharacterized protein (UPF0333 family)